MLQAVVTTIKNGVRFYLTRDGYASDIPERAQVFSYACHAQTQADWANYDPAWRGFMWEVKYRLHNGQLA